MQAEAATKIDVPSEPQPEAPESPKSDVPASEKPENGAEVDAIDEIADNLIGAMPEVQDHVVEMLGKDSPESSKNAELRDVDGTLFDPEVYKSKKDGSPTITKLGRFVKKPLSQRGKDYKAAAGGGRPGSPAQDSAKANALESAKATGFMASRTIVAFAQRFGGDDYKPIKNAETGIDEQQFLDDATIKLFQEKGITDIPVGVAFCLAWGSYFAPRFVMPKTRSRLGRLKDKISAWWLNRRSKKDRFLKKETQPEKTNGE